ncbi:MAG: hypothetical protein WCQ32_00335 [bacterium]
MSNKVMFVTGADTKGGPSVENDLKGKHLKGDNPPSLSFSHQHEEPHVIAKKIKEKKVKTLVFDGLSHERVVAVKRAVHKAMNGTSPKMVQVATAYGIEGVESLLNHAALQEYLQKQTS